MTTPKPGVVGGDTYARNGGRPQDLPREDLSRDDQAPPEATPLRVPNEGLIGVARDIAECYAEVLETPKSFLYFTVLTYLGALVANKVTLDSELRPHPCLYTVLLGESADTRKSTALRKVDEFFRGLGTGYAPPVLFEEGQLFETDLAVLR